MENKIKYGDIMQLGFKEKLQNDSIYEYEFGFTYAIIQFKLKNKCILDYAKETQRCRLIKIDKDHNILESKENLELKEVQFLIKFFGKC